MNEPWFNGNMVGAILGAGLGISGAILGCLAGYYARRGKLKKLVFGISGGIFVMSLTMLAAAVIASIRQQPYDVWFGLGLPGMIGTGIFGSTLPALIVIYRKAELRKSIGRDL